MVNRLIFRYPSAAMDAIAVVLTGRLLVPLPFRWWWCWLLVGVPAVCSVVMG